MLVRAILCPLCLLVVLTYVSLDARGPDSPTRLVGEMTTQPSLPPPLEARDCGAIARDELPNARFARKGGRTTKVRVWREGSALTADDIAQGRDLSQYDELNLSVPRPSLAGEKGTDHSVVPRARIFIWEHWRDRKQAYLTITMSSVDATSGTQIRPMTVPR